MIIRKRVIAMVGVFVVLLAGLGGYEQFGRSAPAFIGATDPAHIAAATAMVKGLPAPAGMTLDPYGTSCDSAGAACFTSSSVQPEAVFATMTKTLVAHGARVRNRACGGANLVEHACMATVDYQGSGITVTAAHAESTDARTFLRLSVSGVPMMSEESGSAAYGSWDSVDPLPAAWTTGVTCAQPASMSCNSFSQRREASPVISLSSAEACATVRRVMESRYYVEQNKDLPATAYPAGGCVVHGHRYRTVGGKDGEVLTVRVYTKDAGHVLVGVTLTANWLRPMAAPVVQSCGPGASPCVAVSPGLPSS